MQTTALACKEQSTHCADRGCDEVQQLPVAGLMCRLQQKLAAGSGLDGDEQ